MVFASAIAAMAPAGRDPGPLHQDHRLQSPELLATARDVAEGVVVVLDPTMIGYLLDICWISVGYLRSNFENHW